jgi:hypothetical protein
MMMLVGTGCVPIEYTVERKGDSCIKFEDAMSYDEDSEEMVEDCLGEDGAVEADWLWAAVLGDVTEIVVTVKAGGGKDSQVSDTMIPVVGESVEILGFTILLESQDENWYDFSVTSDDIEGGKDGTAALSSITFCFGGEGVTVVAPAEGTFETERDEELD